jgi:hypothetical protein
MNMRTKVMIAIFIIIFLTSCRTGFGIRKSDLIPFDKGFSARVQNRASKEITRSHYQHDLNLLPLLSLRDHHSDSIDFFFVNQTRLQISFIENGQRLEKVLDGRMSKRGYFESFFENERIEVPPVIPILYSKYNIDRLRIALHRDGCIIVSRFGRRAGNLLFVTGGGENHSTGCFQFKTHQNKNNAP